MKYVVEVVELRYFKRFMSAVLESLPDHGKQIGSNSFIITGTILYTDVYCILVTIFNNNLFCPERNNTYLYKSYFTRVISHSRG
jgi:hypothetical protein